MKKLKCLLAGFLVLGLSAAMIGCSDSESGKKSGSDKKSESSADADIHKDRREEDLLMVAHQGQFDIYYAYDTNGERLFDLIEHTYGNTDHTADGVYRLFYRNKKKKVSNIIPELPGEIQTEGLLTVIEWIYDTKEDHLIGNTSYEVNLTTDPIEIEFKEKNEYDWNEDGSGYIDGNFRYVMDKNHKENIKEMYRKKDGTEYLAAKYTYDDRGNPLTEESYNEEGSVTYKLTYEYEYDEKGRLVSGKAFNGDQEALTTEYMCLADLPAEELDRPYAGYWTRKEKDHTLFISIAVNNLLCMGYIDEETGLAVTEKYAMYEPNEDGTLYCEFYKNAVREERSDGREVKAAVSGDRLEFDGEEYRLTH